MSDGVLVVDDDESLAENVAEILASLGVSTAIAPTARRRWRWRARATSTSR